MKVIIILLLLSSGNLVFAQPPTYVFNGGDGQGYSLAVDSTTDVFLSAGDVSDGYDMSHIKSNDGFLAVGDAGDGYDDSHVSSSEFFLSQGGEGDGYDIDDTQSIDRFLATGGDGDGYDMKEILEKFIWTGAVGTGWNVAANWNHSEIPDIKRPVVIPAGVPNFPALNAGIFAIGDNPNSGAFVCGSLCILENAIVTTRLNNRIENYGIIEMYGEMRVKNIAVDAFQNFSSGQVFISSTGLLNIKP